MKAKPYPYQIPPVEIFDPTTEGDLEQWEVLEFFRIEALLRSAEVMTLYQKKPPNPCPDSTLLSDSLWMNFAVPFGWNVLEGFHHLSLIPGGMDKAGVNVYKEQPNRLSGILDLKSWFLHPPEDLPPDWFTSQPKDMQIDLSPTGDLKKTILASGERYLYLRIDTAYPPTTILKAIGDLIKPRHATPKIPYPEKTPDLVVLSPDTIIRPIPTHPTKKSPIQDIPVWLKYFKCYDLHQCEGLSFGVIAKSVYPTEEAKNKVNAQDHAKKAFRRVKDLINNAVHGPWPPFSSKRSPQTA